MNKTWKPKNWIAILVGAGVLLTVGATAATLFADRGRTTGAAFLAQPMKTVNNPAPAGSGLAELRMLNDTFADLASSVADSVVEIRPATQTMMGGSGSGFVYRSDGWIITNDHVVSGNTKVTVVMHDGKEYEGTVYSANDPMIDLAVVKIEASNLTPLPVTDSTSVRPGQYAIAVGSPFGLESSVTIGHVSAVNRPGAVMDPRTGAERSYSGMIQTDASINPGNSGGPLININGEVMGVNSTINTTTGASAGIGFAIPSNTVKVVADELIANRKFDRGMLGISFGEDIKPYRLKELGINGGAEVERVPEDGPAYKAGLRVNDIILSIDNDELKNQTDLLLSMYRRSPGDTVTVNYLRANERRSAKVTLGGEDLRRRMMEEGQADRMRNVPPQLRERLRNQEGLPEIFRNLDPDFFRDDNGRGGPQNQQAPGERPRLGVTVESISSAQRSQFRIPADVQGAVVVSVTNNSLASRFGIKVGDVVRTFNGRSITSAADLTAAMAKVKPGDTVELRYTRYSENSTFDQTISVQF